MSKTKKRDKTIEIKGNKYATLDRYIVPIIDRFSFRPTKDFAQYTFGIFNDQEIFYNAVNGEMCFPLKEFAKYINVKIKTMRNKFSLKKDKNILIEKKHFFEHRNNINNPENRDKIRGVKSSIYLTFLGVWKLLPSFRGEIANELYDWFGEKLYALIKSNQLKKGQFLFLSPSGKIISQILGDKTKCFIDEKGFMYSSKGEMLIAKTLRQLNVKFQYNVPINLPERIRKMLINDFPKEILIEAGWRNIPFYITSDFLIRTKPRTIIEYWGLKNNIKYNAKREIKTFIYRELKIKLIDIETHEDQNIPILKVKLIKELKIEV